MLAGGTVLHRRLLGSGTVGSIYRQAQSETKHRLVRSEIGARIYHGVTKFGA
jgi:hypothetical protein